MRNAYHDALDAVTDDLVAMTNLVSTMMRQASQSLLNADREKAESVIAADEEVDAAQQEIENKTTDIMALQQPVATDLRIVLTAMRMSTTLERMGDLAQHVAKVARLRYPDKAIPDALVPKFVEMARVAEEMAGLAAEVIAGKDVELARSIERHDDQMDDLHRAVLDQLLAGVVGTTNEAVDVTLLNRYYERFADHAVSIGRRVVYLVIGERTPDPDAE